ncbi:hypothetical protein [Bradyrhizobium jicamae]|nr:hypothetical protein [Bradyrhizobium jicamae]
MARARRSEIDDECEDALPSDYAPPPQPWENDDCDAAREAREILDAFEVGEIDAQTRYVLHRLVYRAARWLKLGIPGARPGRELVTITLRCILESEGNEAALCELIVRAVAAVVPEFEHRGLALVEAFDQINLLGVLEQMRALEYFYESETSSALERILKHKLCRILTPQPPAPVKQPSKEEQIAAAKAHAAAVRLAVIERSLELGGQLLELRVRICNNREFGRQRSRLGVDDASVASKLMLVARHYGQRPEVYRHVSWRILSDLSATNLPEPRRLDFERRILAGERVRPAEIARARVPGRRGGARKAWN